MKRFGMFVVLLVFTSLACETIMGNAGQAPNQPPAGQAPIQPPVIQLPNLTGVQLGDEFRDEGCGYSFRKVPGYEFDATTGFGPTMTAPGADTEKGPMILLICGVRENARTNADFITALTANTSGTPEANPITYSNQTNVRIGGVNGITIDTQATTSAGIVVKGRNAVAMVTPYRGLVIAGTAPTDQWGQTQAYFEAVMNSVSFFEPTLIPTPTGNP